MAMRKIIYKNTSNGIQDDRKKYNTTLEIVFDIFFSNAISLLGIHFLQRNFDYVQHQLFSTTVALKFVRHLNSA